MWTCRSVLVPHTAKEALHIRATDARYLHSNTWQQFIWVFKSHHAAPYPPHDHQENELSVVVTPLLLLTAAQWTAGWLPDRDARVWGVLLSLGYFTQTSHFLCHRRVHLGRGSLPPLVGLLQDLRLLLHPNVHRRHHETFACNFCIFNGWANPIVNAAFRLAVACGLADLTRVWPGVAHSPHHPHEG
jgi:hypothetical protein